MGIVTDASTASDYFRVFREPDGTLACICMRCLLTVARCTNKDHLEIEAEHLCSGRTISMFIAKE